MIGGKDGPPLGDDDERLWRRVARTVDPLPGRARPAVPERRRGDDGAAEDPPGSAPGAVPPPAPVGRGETASGAVGGIDRNQARRFRRGMAPIEARLDLHGMTRRRARAALDAFLAAAQERGRRCVLVITGKGQRAPLAERAGVLRAELPRWLAAPPNRDRVLDVAPARPRDGGDGAFYVLLRKPR